MFSTPPIKDSLKEIISFTLPKLYSGKEWYVGFMAYDPNQGKMRRKKIKLNHIQKVTERKKYAAGIIARLLVKLNDGWNPWIEAENSNSYKGFHETILEYRKYLAKLVNDGSLRQPTKDSYISRTNMLLKFNDLRKVSIKYIYQFDQKFISEFLDYVYIELNNTVCTHNHYLVWIKNFAKYCVKKQYLLNNPAEGLDTIRQRGSQKSRKAIPQEQMIELRKYLETKNKFYLLACYLLYYTLIRPKEITMLRIQNINLAKQTISITEDIAKNWKNAIVTLPAKVIHLMLDLEIFNYPCDYYIFSNDFKPGKEYKKPKILRDYWKYYIVRDLKFPKEYQFYSLKDTGITQMLHDCDVLSVRDQARHSDISTTNIYAAISDKDADKRLINYDNEF